MNDLCSKQTIEKLVAGIDIVGSSTFFYRGMCVGFRQLLRLTPLIMKIPQMAFAGVCSVIIITVPAVCFRDTWL